MISCYRHNQSHNSQPDTLSKPLSTAVPLCSVLHVLSLSHTHHLHPCGGTRPHLAWEANSQHSRDLRQLQCPLNVNSTAMHQHNHLRQVWCTARQRMYQVCLPAWQL